MRRICASRGLGSFVTMVADSSIPVIGGMVAFGSLATGWIYTYSDRWKAGVIRKTYYELADRYEELERLEWIMYFL